MNVAEVKGIATDWVAAQGQHLPSFRAAHFMGSINRLADDAPFPIQTSDVDMSIIYDGETISGAVDLEYKGLMLEYGLRNTDVYESAEKILADAGLAPELIVDSIITDPDKLLTKLQSQVKREYKQHKWVHARLDHEKQVIQWNIDHLSTVDNVFDALNPIWVITMYLTGAIAVANLDAPTHRKSLIHLKELLAQHEQLDLHENVLEFFGVANLTHEQVMDWLNHAMAAFDYALTVRKSAGLGDWKLHPHLRPYFYEGSLEMIQAGYHREAAHMVAVAHAIAMSAIQIDGDDAAKQTHGAPFGQALALLDFAQPEGIERRIKQAPVLATNIYAVAEAIIAAHPDIVD